MSKKDILIDINETLGLPRSYRFNPFLRFFTILMAIGAIGYGVWYIFNGVDADSSSFHKGVPFVILFFAFSSLLKNFLSINSVYFEKEQISFKYLGRKNTTIKWDSIKKISFSSGKSRFIILNYDNGEKLIDFQFTIAFPKMIEILNAIAELCPQAEYDEFISNVIVSTEAKQ